MDFFSCLPRLMIYFDGSDILTCFQNYGTAQLMLLAVTDPFGDLAKGCSNLPDLSRPS